MKSRQALSCRSQGDRGQATTKQPGLQPLVLPLPEHARHPEHVVVGSKHHASLSLKGLQDGARLG